MPNNWKGTVVVRPGNAAIGHTHKCAIPGCCATCGRTKLMCWGHWGMVPKHLQVDCVLYYEASNYKDLAISRRAAINAVLALLGRDPLPQPTTEEVNHIHV